MFVCFIFSVSWLCFVILPSTHSQSSCWSIAARIFVTFLLCQNTLALHVCVCGCMSAPPEKRVPTHCCCFCSCSSTSSFLLFLYFLADQNRSFTFRISTCPLRCLQLVYFFLLRLYLSRVCSMYFGHSSLCVLLF